MKVPTGKILQKVHCNRLRIVGGGAVLKCLLIVSHVNENEKKIIKIQKSEIWKDKQ